VNRKHDRGGDTHPIVTASLILLALAMAWWCLDGFAERRAAESQWREGIRLRESGIAR